MLTQSRQRAAVSSVYEDTPQGGPQSKNESSFDPFAPKGTPEADASLISPEVTSQFQPITPSLSTQFPPVQADSRTSAGLTGSFPSLTGSFPSLTGSFPSLTGAMPKVSARDFGGGSTDTSSDDFDFGSFGSEAPAEIQMPESRMHDMFDNAKEGVGGLFSRFGRKKKSGDSTIDSWGDESGDDDFGWKGGGYDNYEGRNAHDAARARAAQIRESVVSMTEEDLLDKEVWFVALGASNAGNRGMKNFLELHSSELRGALIINLEAVGSGDICFIDYEGEAKVCRSDRRLQSLVRGASKELGKNEIAAERLNWRETDATPALKAGHRAMTIMGFDGVAPTGWHWSSDTIDIVEKKKMNYVTRLLLKMIENS